MRQPPACRTVTPVTGRVRKTAWVLAESANEPTYGLIQRYVFASYFVSTLGAGSAGEAMWGLTLGLAGLIVALFGPVVGALADAAGRVKPLLLLCATGLFLANLSLWWAVPGVPLWQVALLVAAGAALVEFVAILTNAFLPRVAGAADAGILSGLSLGLAQLTGIVLLLLILLLGGSAATPHLADRAAGPLAALALALFLLPLLLLIPDNPRRGTPGPLLRKGLTTLLATLRDAWANRPIRWLLIGRMFGNDGMALVFAFAGILAGSAYGWGARELAIYGIAVTLAAASGALASGWIALRLGTTRLLLASLMLVALGLAGILLTDETRLWGVATGAPAGTFLQSPQQIGFLLTAMLVALGAGPAYAAMRALMATLAPPDRAASYFGLFSVVGKASAFVGPLAVGLATAATGNLRLALTIGILFLIAALGCFARIRVA
ncbi:MFS transporter [Sandaracinobacteroides saxicola]|uniref:MFS transporter n=1 Tax=Sandaracinobacteroides saxicola TaxID=2759707 RepID=A0A7G5IFK8_9SPHN|nr:MFS transporter [Sandaracinobacteroides saxicola]QMW22150.1 MFS transporter [Sandaracinobacteroides saxicola]